MRMIPAALAAMLLLAGCSWSDSGSGDAEPTTPEPQPSTSPSAPTVTATSAPAPDVPFDQRTGAEVAAAGSAAMGSVTSLRYRLSVRGGTRPSTALDVRASDAGDCTGSVSVGDGRIQVLGTPDQQWFKADAAAWRQISPDQSRKYIRAAGDHWVLDDGFEVANVCLFQQLLGQTFQDAGTGSWFTVGSGQVDGRDVIRIQGPSAGGAVAVAAVRVDEPHYLASFQRTYDSDGAVSAGRFSEFQRPVDVEAPADDDVVDLSSLQ
jgi:hypothetical protein